LKVLLDHYQRMKDEWRILSYRKAISAIKRQKEPITSYQEAIEIRGIGHRTAEKIAEIINTGNLKRLQHFSKDDEDLRERIPRDEVTEISKRVEVAACKIDPKLLCITAGSYIRGQPTCGDIDIMLTRNNSDGKSSS
ncbi:10187_t:CDS:2, partial [Racocetra fulgida]